MGIEILIGSAVGIMTLIGGILRLQHVIDGRFDTLERRLEQAVSKVELDTVKITSELEKHEYFINSNKEAVSHARKRFHEELTRIEADVKDLRSLVSKLQQQQTGTRVLPPPH